MPVWLEVLHWVATLLLGGGLIDTRRKIKAERTLRQENKDVEALDQCANALIDMRKLYHRRRENRARFFRGPSDEDLQSARMQLNTAANRVSSEELVPLIDEYHDIGGQYAARAIEVNNESEEQSYRRATEAIARLRRDALEP
ncbi:hypothetical protein ACWKWC_12085 [Geodermatophilus nigrescens]